MTTVAIQTADRDRRERLRALASAIPGVTAADADAEAADIVIADWPLAGFPQRPGASLVALVAEDDAPSALEALHAGARAILPPSAEAADLAAALAAIAAGRSLVPTGLLAAIVAKDAPAAPSGPDPGLTQRELEVLRALADGASNKEIARRLGISFSTVKFHVASILTKLDADSRTEAVAQAARLGLVML